MRGTLSGERRAELAEILEHCDFFGDVLEEAQQVGLYPADVLAAVRFPDEPERPGALPYDPGSDWLVDLVIHFEDDLDGARLALAASGRDPELIRVAEHLPALRAAWRPDADVDAVLARSSAPEVVDALVGHLSLARLVEQGDRLPPGAASAALLRRFREAERWAAIPRLDPAVAWRALPDRFPWDGPPPDPDRWIAARVAARAELGGSWWEVVAFAEDLAPWTDWLPSLVAGGLDDNAAALIALERGASIPEVARRLIAGGVPSPRVLDAIAACLGGPTPALVSLADAGWTAASLASLLRGQGRLAAEIREHLRELGVPEAEAEAHAAPPAALADPSDGR